MKNLIIILLSIWCSGLFAQVKGDGNVVTKNIDLNKVEKIEIGLYAKTTIIKDGGSSMSITIDENLFEHVNISESDQVLTINQKEWIQPSKDIVISINSQFFNSLSQSTHDETIIQDFKGERLVIEANTGKIKANGYTDFLQISVGVADINTEALKSKKAEFFFESWGTIRADISEELIANANKKSNLFLVSKPKEFSGNAIYKVIGEISENLEYENIRFIDFTIKNNSGNRHNFYVKGPKPDGSNFSYGFPMMPLQKRDKLWTNGTKVYKVNNLGLRQLVKIITLEDEGKVVNIFEK